MRERGSKCKKKNTKQQTRLKTKQNKIKKKRRDDIQKISLKKTMNL